jgi:alginate O-acetyltransferase complex protein AlgJ
MAVEDIAIGWKSFIGKSEWLFLRDEFAEASSENDTKQSIELIARINTALARNGIAMIFTMPPLKAQIYERYLPGDVALTPYLSGHYQAMINSLVASGVNVVDISQAFLSSPKRDSDTPLFFRLDTHWSPSGSMLAAEAVRAEINGNPGLRDVLANIPEVRFDMVWSKKMEISEARDMTKLLPAGSPVFASEQRLPFFVRKKTSTATTLTGTNSIGVTLLGSSYSAWYGYSEALNYTLQREILTVHTSAIQGSWYGMESYFRDDAFQTNPPKLLIWEMPARLVNRLPDSRTREERYRMDNTEWLLRTAAWVERECAPSPITAKVVVAGLVTDASGTVSAGRTTDKDFIEVNFNKPLDRLDYLQALVTTTGSKKLLLEASGAGVETRWIDFVAAGDGAEHVMKTPLPSRGKGFTKLKIYPGKNNSFIFKELMVCRHPAALLK